jgi:ribosomal protein L11 methyltransferase
VLSVSRGGWRVEISLPRRAAAAAAEALEALGLAVAFKPAGRFTRLWVYGTGEPDSAALAVAFGRAVAVEPVPEIDWAARLQQDFPPLRVGRFFIHGSHLKGKPPRGAIAIRIDAGAAFGTGSHESTRSCLRALSRLPLRGRRVLDMGCGSGILAIAAAKHGATALALDNDAQAVCVAQENVVDNGVAGAVHVARSDGWRGVVGQFDVVVENILARPVIRMAPALARNLAPGGIAVLAGFLTRDAPRVLAAHRAQGLNLAGRIVDGEWTALLVRRRAVRRRRSRVSAAAPRRGTPRVPRRKRRR